MIQVILKSAVNPLKHKANLINGILNITLYKEEPKIWGSLEADKKLDENFREQVDSENKLISEQLKEMRQSKKIEEERFSLRKQMKLDETERGKIESLKQQEKEAAENAVYDTLSKLESNHSKLKELPNSDSNEKKSNHFSIDQIPKKNHEYKIGDDNKNDDSRVVDYESDESYQIEEIIKTPNVVESCKMSRDIPPPRNPKQANCKDGSNKVLVQFSQRLFPTPLRESKVLQEQDWITKNYKGLKSHAIFSKNLKSSKSLLFTID